VAPRAAAGAGRATLAIPLLPTTAGTLVLLRAGAASDVLFVGEEEEKEGEDAAAGGEGSASRRGGDASAALPRAVAAALGDAGVRLLDARALEEDESYNGEDGGDAQSGLGGLVIDGAGSGAGGSARAGGDGRAAALGRVAALHPALPAYVQPPTLRGVVAALAARASGALASGLAPPLPGAVAAGVALPGAAASPLTAAAFARLMERMDGRSRASLRSWILRGAAAAAAALGGEGDAGGGGARSGGGRGASALAASDIAILRLLPLFRVYADATTANSSSNGGCIALEPEGALSEAEEARADEGAAAGGAGARACRPLLLAEAATLPRGLLSFHRRFLLLDEQGEAGGDGAASASAGALPPPPLGVALAGFRALGVRALRAADFFARFLLAPGTLLALPPDVRDAALLYLLRALPAIAREAPEFVGTLAATPFVPTRALAQAERAGEAAAPLTSAARALRRPRELFDPSLPTLAVLLDADLFPSPALAADGEALAALRSLGLATAMSRAAILESARSVERLCTPPILPVAVSTKAAQGGGAAHAGVPAPPPPAEGLDEVRARLCRGAARATALLRHVDENGRTLFVPSALPAAAPSTAAAMQA
jgi:hypothetical protein